jgi:hypothetical protein
MIAEQAADLMRGCASLAPVNIEALTPKNPHSQASL